MRSKEPLPSTELVVGVSGFTESQGRCDQLRCRFLLCRRCVGGLMRRGGEALVGEVSGPLAVVLNLSW